MEIHRLRVSIQALRDELAGLKDLFREALPGLAAANGASVAESDGEKKAIEPTATPLARQEDTLVTKPPLREIFTEAPTSRETEFGSEKLSDETLDTGKLGDEKSSDKKVGDEKSGDAQSGG